MFGREMRTFRRKVTTMFHLLFGVSFKGKRNKWQLEHSTRRCTLLIDKKYVVTADRRTISRMASARHEETENDVDVIEKNEVNRVSLFKR